MSLIGGTEVAHTPQSHRLAALYSTEVACETKHKDHYKAKRQLPACDCSTLTDHSSRSAHTVHQLELPLRTTDCSSKNGKLAGAKTVPKPRPQWNTPRASGPSADPTVQVTLQVTLHVHLHIA